MKKFVAAGTAILAAGAITLSVGLAKDTTGTDDASTMMGGDCPMMSMMGHGKMGHGMMRQGKMQHQGRMGAMVKGRLAYLKAALDVTDAQKPAWDAYAEAVNDRVATMQGMRASMMSTMQEGGAVDRMEARISGMEAMVDAMKAVKPATEALYAALSEDQKKKADELIGLGCGGM